MINCFSVTENKVRTMPCLMEAAIQRAREISLPERLKVYLSICLNKLFVIAIVIVTTAETIQPSHDFIEYSSDVNRSDTNYFVPNPTEL